MFLHLSSTDGVPRARLGMCLFPLQSVAQELSPGENRIVISPEGSFVFAPGTPGESFEVFVR